MRIPVPTASRRRRTLVALLVVAGPLTAPACTATVAGHGTFVATDDDVPPVHVTRSADTAGSRVCSVITDELLADLFGGPVSVTVPSNGLSCEFTATGTSDYVDLTMRLDDRATDGMLADSEPITVHGHPGMRDAVTVSVATGDDIDQPGCLRGDNFFSSENADRGLDITEALVEAAIDDFTNG